MEVNGLKHFFILIVIILVIALCFAGCSQNNQNPGPTASSTYIPYPDTEDNRDNYNNGLAIQETGACYKY